MGHICPVCIHRLCCEPVGVTPALPPLQAAFGYKYKCVEQPVPAPRDHLLRVLPRAFSECMYRIGNPLRATLPCLFKWGKVPSLVTWGERGKKSVKVTLS